MRKAIFIFIAIILVAVSGDWIDACSEVRTDKELSGPQYENGSLIEGYRGNIHFSYSVTSFVCYCLY